MLFIKKIYLYTKIHRLIKTSTTLHLGCDTKKIPGAINVDIRKTSATDLVLNGANLLLFPTSSISTIFTSAFLEHLYRDERIDHLKQAHRILKEDGILFESNIPYFPEVAKLYLSKSKGIFKKTFDLEHVYHYTHGMPEAQPTWWLAQLHKSLFDVNEVKNLLDTAGFKHYTIFQHSWKDEKPMVCFSFLASKKKFLPSLFSKMAKHFDKNINHQNAILLFSQ